MRNRWRALLLGGAILAPMVAMVPAVASPPPITFDVQSYNLSLGADLTPLFGATDIASLRAGAAKVYADVEESRPPERMAAVAKIIAREHPDVVGLQEVALWSLAPYVTVGGLPFPSGPYQASFDFLSLLLNDLAKYGLHYDVASVNTNFDSAEVIPIAIPISDTTAARYTDRNVVLVDPHSNLQTSNPQEADFQARFSVTLLGVTVPVYRGWASVDLSRHGHTFRFFDTHLEAYGAPPLKDQFRNPQAAELAALVEASPYPTMVVGDINARPTMCATWRQPPDPDDANTVAYGTLVGAGLTEVWPLVHPDDPCSPNSWTSGQNSLYGPVSTLTHRIDDVFVTDDFRALTTTVVGDTAQELSRPNGLWPSDHASTAARVQLS